MAYAAYKRVQNLIATGARPTEDDWAHVYAWRNPMTLAELLADSGGYAVDANAPASGEYVASDRIWTKDGYILDVAASGASDHDRTTAGGVKLYDIDVSPALVEARVTTAEGGITTLQGQMTTAQGDITTAEGDITALQAQMSEALSDIASHLLEITSLKSRVLQLEVGGAPTPLFTNSAGTLDSEWIGAVPQKGLVYCEFTAPDFASMSDREGLFTIRLTGGGGGHHGAAVSLEKNAGRFSFGVRDLSSNSSFEQGHGFHPGKLHKVWFSYDLDTGECSLMVDTGTVQYAAAHASYTGGVTSDRVSLWYQRFSGTAAGLSSGRGTISLYDAGDFS